ncbi:hypothetical protein SAMN06297387_12921 [Streptomyces zhaozhouensis]|uniref:Helix-turn-helix n=1 Tax=Streptomyces zhaozhouensis TaxID=1300267 RepID=A0A286E8I4_9ACTN|nr:hypothetical protein [Streptomyces zhaozhouensis]SOD67190.1 hypothetical protein SAMN06297387_12921 [Streptomyces zhaozhouensis]
MATETAASSTTVRPRTLAEKLSLARESRTPRGEEPASFEVLARRITERTGVDISGAYLRELTTGRSTNPASHHLRALADYFALPVGYLADDDAGHERLAPELALLARLRQHDGTRGTEARDAPAGPDDLPTLRRVLDGLRQLDTGDPGDGATAPRVPSIGTDPELLAALADSTVREIAARVGSLSPESRSTVLSLVIHLGRLQTPRR